MRQMQFITVKEATWQGGTHISRELLKRFNRLMIESAHTRMHSNRSCPDCLSRSPCVARLSALSALANVATTAKHQLENYCHLWQIENCFSKTHAIEFRTDLLPYDRRSQFMPYAASVHKSEGGGGRHVRRTLTHMTLGGKWQETPFPLEMHTRNAVECILSIIIKSRQNIWINE